MSYDDIIKYKGNPVVITMNSGAKYAGQFSYGNKDNGGKITLTKLVICSVKIGTIYSKRDRKRKFWVSEIKNIAISKGE